MSLNRQQVNDLGEAIAAYQFPAVYFDFDKGSEVKAPDMGAVEAAIGGMLVSTATDRVCDGLANVIYWGYAQIGCRNERVQRFRDQVTADQLSRFTSLVRSGSAGLIAIGALRLPQFSGISFVSRS